MSPSNNSSNGFDALHEPGIVIRENGPPSRGRRTTVASVAVDYWAAPWGAVGLLGLAGSNEGSQTGRSPPGGKRSHSPGQTARLADSHLHTNCRGKPGSYFWERRGRDQGELGGRVAPAHSTLPREPEWDDLDCIASSALPNWIRDSMRPFSSRPFRGSHCPYDTGKRRQLLGFRPASGQRIAEKASICSPRMKEASV